MEKCPGSKKPINRRQSFQRIGRFKVWRSTAHQARADSNGTLVTKAGEVAIQGETTVGAGDDCDVTLSGANIEDEHARIFPRSGRLFCRALTGDADDFTGATRTWILPDTELRPGVDYMLAPGTQLAFGDIGGDAVTVQFEEAAGDGGAGAKVMMDLMASAMSPEVREEMERQQRSASAA